MRGVYKRTAYVTTIKIQCSTDNKREQPDLLCAIWRGSQLSCTGDDQLIMEQLNWIFCYGQNEQQYNTQEIRFNLFIHSDTHLLAKTNYSLLQLQVKLINHKPLILNQPNSTSTLPDISSQQNEISVIVFIQSKISYHIISFCNYLPCDTVRHPLTQKHCQSHFLLGILVSMLYLCVSKSS